jgi:hypothetical protein
VGSKINGGKKIMKAVYWSKWLQPLAAAILSKRQHCFLRSVEGLMTWVATELISATSNGLKVRDVISICSSTSFLVLFRSTAEGGAVYKYVCFESTLKNVKLYST